MFSAGREPVWHRLGQRTETAVTSAAAMRMPGLDWKVMEHHLTLIDADEDFEDESQRINGISCTA